MPPASSVARVPPFSSAAIRPSQPPLRLRARSPSRHVRGTTGSRLPALLRAPLGQALEGLLGAGERGVDGRRGDRLALEPAAHAGHVVAQLLHEALRPPRGPP